MARAAGAPGGRRCEDEAVSKRRECFAAAVERVAVLRRRVEETSSRAGGVGSVGEGKEERRGRREARRERSAA